MSVGFFIGFVFSDHSATTEHYPGLFLFATSGNFLAIVLAALNWKTLADRNTPLLDAERRAFSGRFVAGIAILIALVPTVWFLLQHPGSTETLVKAICRSEERRVGKECVSTCRSRWSPDHSKKYKNNTEITRKINKKKI